MIANGTQAAAVPMAVPIMSLVNGIKKTTNNKNGNERIILTSKFKIEKAHGFSSK